MLEINGMSLKCKVITCNLWGDPHWRVVRACHSHRSDPPVVVQIRLLDFVGWNISVKILKYIYEVMNSETDLTKNLNAWAEIYPSKRSNYVIHLSSYTRDNIFQNTLSIIISMIMLICHIWYFLSCGFWPGCQVCIVSIYLTSIYERCQLVYLRSKMIN